MSKKQAFVDFIKAKCADDSVGYSQLRRMLNPDVDCSSLVLLACNYAYGTNYTSGYTGTIRRQLEAVGFKTYPFNGTVADAEVGEVYLNEGQHVETVVLPGKMGGAHIDENGGITGSRGGDQTGNEVSIVGAYIYKGGWQLCLVPPEEAESTPVPLPIEVVPSTTKDIDTVAKEVLAGLWGNNPSRHDKLVAAGHNYALIQRRVNEIIAQGNTNAGNVVAVPDLDTVAWEVIRGKYGNGELRAKTLTAAGWDAKAVQRRVNELLG
jgi:hypothetical protein